MDTTKLIEYIPGMVILISIMILTVTILIKFGDKIFDKEYKVANILLLVTVLLFIIILIVHLFKEQTWTSDTLKILIGVLVGAASSKVDDKEKRKSENGNSVEISGDAHGDVAGRDINKNIQNINDAISEIKDSIVHQNNKINNFTKESSKKDYLINTIYERGENIREAVEKIVNHWETQGWILKTFSSDYNGMDGVFLVFTKPSEEDESRVFYYHSSRMELL